MSASPVATRAPGAWRRKLLVVAGAVGAIAIAAAAAIAFRLRTLDEETVRRALVERLESTLGTRVEVRRAELSVFAGLTLHGLGIAEPRPLRGKLLESEAFVLRYRPWPLLLGRLEVDRLALVKPALFLRMDRRGVFNYERLAPAAAAAESGTVPAVALPLRVRLRGVQVEDGSVTITDATGAALARVEGAAFDAALELDGGLLTGTGGARVATLALADCLFLRDATAPLRMSREEIGLAPIRGRLGEGKASGEATVRLAGGFRYAVDLAVDGARVETLLAEARATPTLSGRMRGRAHYEGTGGLATVRGRGEADVRDCRLTGSRAATLLGAVLGLPELERPEFDECRLTFTQAGSRVTMPSLTMRGRALQLDGRGSMLLDTGALDYDLTLALAPNVFARLTRPELRSAFRTRPDDYAEVEFRLTGTTREPRTDLAARVAKAAAGKTLTDTLSRWLGSRKRKP